VSGVTYKTSHSYTRTALKSDQTLGVDNLEVIGMLDDSSISEADMQAGLFDYAQVQMFIVNWADLSQGILRLRQGWLGEVVLTPTGLFKAELRGLTQALTTQWGDLFSPICRADLGDPQCGINLSAITNVGTVLAVTDRKRFNATPSAYVPFSTTSNATISVLRTLVNSNSGLGIRITISGNNYDFGITPGSNVTSAMTQLINGINGAGIGIAASSFFGPASSSFVVVLTMSSVFSANITKFNDTFNYLSIHSFADAYMNGGQVTWTSGNNNGVSIEVNSYTQSDSFWQLFSNMVRPIQVGDTFNYSPGCDKRRETCYFKFNNMDNFRGEPDMPGMDAMLTYPEFSQSAASGGFNALG
jgi:hypothetical protein